MRINLTLRGNWIGECACECNSVLLVFLQNAAVVQAGAAHDPDAHL